MVEMDLTHNKKTMHDQYEEMLDFFNIKLLNGIWAYKYEVENKNLPAYGFKIHISATSENCIQIGYKVLKYLEINRLSFKICKSLNDLIKLNSAEYGYSQIGKFITIYPQQDSNINKHLMRINLLTKFDRSISIPSDYNYLNSEVVYFRYGELVDNSKGSNEFIDKRTRYIPDNVENLINYSSLDRYIKIPEYLHPLSIIENSKKSIVMVCFDENTKSKYILKIGKHLTDIEENNIDSADRILNEYQMLRKFEKNKNIVTPINLIMIKNNIALLEEYIEGDSLLEIIKENKVIRKNKEFIIKELIDTIQNIHDKMIYLGDLSLANIMVTKKDNMIKLIDLEYFHQRKDPVYIYYNKGTLGFYKDKISGKQADLFSLVKIIYYLYNPEEYNEDLKNKFENIVNTDKRALSDFQLSMGKFTQTDEESYTEILKKIFNYLNRRSKNDQHNK